MKKLVTANAGTLGPFEEVVSQADRYVCDGVDYPHTVIGAASVEDTFPGELPEPAELVERARETKRAQLDAAYAVTTQAGFLSSALGSPHGYPSTIEAQLDLIGTVVRGKPSPFACVDGNGVRAARNHTYPQIQQVLEDGAAHKLALYTNLQTKLAAVGAATTVADVLAVNW